MASFYLISLLLIIIYSTPSSSSSSSELNISEVATHVSGHKVNLSLYYESLCPSSESFIVDDLANAYKTDLMSIINLHLVPYGNAHINYPNKTVVCQHGPLECYYNTIEACAIAVWPLKVNFPFIQCVENRLQQKQDKTVWESCCKELRLDPKSIKRCYESGHGKELILRNANATGSLNPPHQYVPWVTVDSKPIFSDLNNLTNYVCNAYKGHPKPRACNIINSTKKMIKATHPPCYE